MQVNVKSPDDVLLYLTAGFIRGAYRGFGISPLAVQFYPILATLVFSAFVFLFISFNVAVGSASYGAVAGISGWWAHSFWKDHEALRKDARGEWTITLYRKYEALATLRRERLGWIRMVMLANAIFVLFLTFSDISEEISQLSTWQRCVFPLNMWALTAFMYCKSAELPLPGNGDFFSAGRTAAGFGHG